MGRPRERSASHLIQASILAILFFQFIWRFVYICWNGDFTCDHLAAKSGVNSLTKRSGQPSRNLQAHLITTEGIEKTISIQDSNFKPRSMYDIKNKYTILYIFDPDCGHCRKETPKLVAFYNKLKIKFNVEVYAVNADTSMAKIRNYIKEMKMPWITVNGPRTYVGPYQDHYDANTMPSLYILDDKKKIIGKKVPTEKLEDFFTNYEKFQKAKATQKL